MALGTKERGEKQRMDNKEYKEMYTRLNEYKRALLKADKIRLELQEEKDKIYRPVFTIFDKRDELDPYKLRAYTPRELEEIKSRINEIIKRLSLVTAEGTNAYRHSLAFIRKLRNEGHEEILRRVHLVREFDYEDVEYNAETMNRLYHNALDKLIDVLKRDGGDYGR